MSTLDADALYARVSQWIANDPDPATQAEARALLALAKSGNADAVARLSEAFSGRLEFGTAGLRAELGAGPRRMNRVVVAQTSAGFAEFLLSRARSGATHTPPSVVIGYDGRVNSDVFARDVAEIMQGAGVQAILLPSPLPTPVTAFAVRHLAVSAGVMITASHNPPRDNGYKVYLGDGDGGSQIIAPSDAEIAAHIARIAERPCGELPRSTDYRVAGVEIVEAYVAAAAAAIRADFESSDLRSTPTIVYTALHGVGSETARRVFAAAQLPAVIPVVDQDTPDGTFPTVAFPNPEEAGALDLAYATARIHGADLIVANDPDADRLAIAAPHAEEPSGYRRLSGNELGLLLGWRAAERAHRASKGSAPRGTLANTIVSSPALGAVARHYGLEHAETLSGFKWVSRVPELVFGFEEALGYLTHPQVLRDKDGILAAADAVVMACELHASGRTVWDLIDEASDRFGYFASSQIVLRLESSTAVATLTERIRQSPPESLGKVPVTRVRDYLNPGHASVPANVLAYDLADGSRVMIRPSGTEPKLKTYLDVVSTHPDAAARRTAAGAALQRLEEAVHTFLQGMIE